MDRITQNEIENTKNFAEFTAYLKSKFNFNSTSILFIDEAQESKKLGNYVREMKEVWKTNKVILSGSSMSKLIDNENTRMPVGRIEYLNLYPFSFSEFLRWHQKEHLLDEALSLKEKITLYLHQEILNHFNNYIYTGGLPEVVKAFPDPKFKTILQTIYLSQKEDFLRKEPNEPYLFFEALQAVSNHVGYPSKYSHISSNQYQSKKILEKLIQWNLIYNVDLQSLNTTSTISNKRYIYDLGVLNLLRNVPTPKIEVLETLNEVLREPLGGIVENAVLNESLNHSANPSMLSSWKKNSKQNIEVDFVMDINNEKLPIEVKASLKVHPRMAKNIMVYLNTFSQEKGVLVSLDSFKKMNIDGFQIYNVPAYLPIGETFSQTSDFK